MNTHETTEIRELTATELDHVSGGLLGDGTVVGWLVEFALTFKTRAIHYENCAVNC
jgi:hypothetical protein